MEQISKFWEGSPTPARIRRYQFAVSPARKLAKKVKSLTEQLFVKMQNDTAVG